jgi:GMP synthase-like glutamine amidotransferase
MTQSHCHAVAMKPVAIFRHSPTEGPGYFSDYLDERAIPWRIVRIDAGEAVPGDPRHFSGVALMGGPMSVNDPLPWIPQVLAFIRDAMDADVPVVGHCLGGQLMSRALGGQVSRNPVKEIGWGPIHIEPTATARDWFGEVREFLSFHWHGETFTIPPHAERLASSRWCANQTFVIGPHLGMQCHVEMTPALIASWCESGLEEIAAERGVVSVQTPEAMQAQVAEKVSDLNAVARRLYDRWTMNLVHD